MHPIQDSGKGRHVIEKSVEMFDRILVGQIQSKLPQNLLVHISMSDIRDVCVYHQREQVENQICAFAKDDESRETETLETAIVNGLDSAHCVDHLLAELYWGSENLRVSSEDVPEVD